MTAVNRRTALSILGLMLSVLVGTPAGGAPGTENCPPDTKVITGDSGNNHLVGTDDDDCIVAGAGDDTIDGLEGDDTIYGGPGNDHVNGGGGNDNLYGGDGHDEMTGGGGEDIGHRDRDDEVKECETCDADPTDPSPDVMYRGPTRTGACYP